MYVNPQRRQEAQRLYLDAGETTTQIARRFRVSGETVRQWLMVLGVTRRSRAERFRKYHHRGDAFSKPTPTTAYFAGLLLADGNVQPRDGLVQISLSAKDAYLVEALCAFLEHTGPLFYFTRQHRSGTQSHMVALRVVAHDLIQPLAQWGVIPRKSHDGTVPPELRNSAIEEFYFRGLFDGDGCVHRRPTTKRLYVSLCGTPAIIDAFRDWCWREVREAGSLHRRSVTTHVVQFGGAAAIVVGKRLYQSTEAPRLKRKARLIK